MKKYWQIFKVSWQESLIYRVNFLVWRLRSLIGFLGIYWFWQAVFSHNSVIAAYRQPAMYAYLVVALVLRHVVFSNVSYSACVEIANGNLNNFLVKPLNYLGYWFARDWADKALNLLLFTFEALLLIWLLNLPLKLPTDFIHGLMFIGLALMASLMYFFFSFLTSAFSFWYPEHDGWPLRFLMLMLLEFLAGTAFPLDIFPPALIQLFKLLPFYYFVYYPAQFYLGRADPGEFLLMAGWLVLLIILRKIVWKKGQMVYGAYGR